MSLTSAKTSVRFWFVIFSKVSSRIRSLKGNRRPHISHFLCSSFIKFDMEHFLRIRGNLSAHKWLSTTVHQWHHCGLFHSLEAFPAGSSSSLPFTLLLLALSSGPTPLSRSLPPFFPPSPCNKSQSVYNPSGTVHNSSGSNCSSIYIRQCRELASLIWDTVVRRVYIPRSDCLSSTLVRLNRCHTEPSRAVESALD